MTLYSRTLVSQSARWSRMAPTARVRLNRFSVALHVTALALGFVDPQFWHLAVALAAADVVLGLALTGGNLLAFPVQLRMAYASSIAAAVFVPAMRPMLYTQTLGLTVFLLFDYCLLSRMLFLMPWNRQRAFSWHLLWQTLTHPPQTTRFAL